MVVGGQREVILRQLAACLLWGRADFWDFISDFRGKSAWVIVAAPLM